MSKVKLSQFQNPTGSFQEYYDSLPWYAFIEKYRVNKLRRENLLLQEADKSNKRLNEVEALTLRSYIKSLIERRRELVKELVAIANSKNTEFELSVNEDNIFDTAIYKVPRHRTHLRNIKRVKVSVSEITKQFKLKDFRRAVQLAFLISKVDDTLVKSTAQATKDKLEQKAISLEHNGTTGVTDSDWQYSNTVDTIALSREQITLEPAGYRYEKYTYLYAEDFWTTEDSAILYRILAHAIRVANITIPIDGESVALSIEEALKAPEQRHIGLYDKEQEKQKKHLDELLKLISQLNFRFVRGNSRPNIPTRIELHSGITKDKANLAGTTWLNITDDVVRDCEFHKHPKQLRPTTDAYALNNACATKLCTRLQVREAFIDVQNAHVAPGYGRDKHNNVFPLTDGKALKDYISTKVFVPESINFNQSLDDLIAELDAWINNRDNIPDFLDWLFNNTEKKNALINRKHILHELICVKEYRDYISNDGFAKNSEVENLFNKFLEEKAKLYSIKHPYNRFTKIENDQLLGLAYESQNQIERYQEFRKEINTFKPTNFFTRWWRGKALKACEKREQELDIAIEELNQYRSALAEEMLIRINKYGLTADLPRESNLFQEYCGFIEQYGSSDVQTKLKTRLNYRAHLTQLLSAGHNDTNRESITKYINALIEYADGLEKASLITLKKILLGDVLDELNVEHMDFLKSYFCLPRTKPAQDDKVGLQTYEALAVLNREIRKKGFDTNTLPAFLAIEFAGTNLSRIFTKAQETKELINTDEDRRKIRTYAQLIDTFSSDQMAADSILGKYRILADNNVKWFKALLMEGKLDNVRIASEQRFEAADIRVKYLPIAVLPNETKPSTKYGYEQLLKQPKSYYLGVHVIPRVDKSDKSSLNRYAQTICADDNGSYKGNDFALNTVISVIGDQHEKGRYIEKRLFDLLKSGVIPLTHMSEEIKFIGENCKNNSDNIDNVLRYTYYTFGWSTNLQKLVDTIGTPALQEEVRIDKIEALLKVAAVNGCDKLNTDELSYVQYLLEHGISADNFVTRPEFIAKFEQILKTYLQDKHKPNALLESVIFNFTKSNDYRDAFVIKELQAKLKENNSDSLSAFYRKWEDRLSKKLPLYTKHLVPSSGDTESDAYVDLVIVTKNGQPTLEKVVTDAIRAKAYNTNHQWAVPFTSRMIQHELSLKLITEHLLDANAANWRYLPLDKDEMPASQLINATEEQKSRHAQFTAVKQSANKNFSTVNSYLVERGFGKRVEINSDKTSAHQLESTIYQGFHHDTANDYIAALTAVYGENLVRRMQDTYGLINIDHLKSFIGENNLFGLAILLDTALQRAEKIIKEGRKNSVTQITQVMWIASNIISEAFVYDIKQKIARLPAGDVAKNAELYNRLSELLTTLNRLRPQIESASHVEVLRKHAEMLLAHDDFERFFDQGVLETIRIINSLANQIAITDNNDSRKNLQNCIQAYQALLQDLCHSLVERAKLFRTQNNHTGLFAKLQSAYKIAIERNIKPHISDVTIVHDELTKSTSALATSYNVIFDEANCLANKAAQIKQFLSDVHKLLDSQKYDQVFDDKLAQIITKHNMTLIAFLSRSELFELQAKSDLLISKLVRSPDKQKVITAFANILRGIGSVSEQKSDVDTIELYPVHRKIEKFAFEDADCSCIDVETLLALKNSKFGLPHNQMHWSLVIKTILQRYECDVTLNPVMLAIVDVFGNEGDQCQADAIRKARAFIDNSSRYKAYHHMRADVEFCLTHLNKESTLYRTFETSYLTFQRHVAADQSNYRNMAVINARGELLRLLDVNNVANRCDNNDVLIAQHIEKIVWMFSHVHLNHGDHRAVDQALTRFITQFNAQKQQRPLVNIPCGTSFALRLIASLGSESDNNEVKRVCAEYDQFQHAQVMTVENARKAADAIVHVLNVDIASIRGKTVRQQSFDRMMLNYEKTMKAIDVLVDNKEAVDAFINMFNEKIKINQKIPRLDSRLSNFASIKQAIVAAAECELRTITHVVEVSSVAVSPARNENELKFAI